MSSKENNNTENENIESNPSENDAVKAEKDRESQELPEENPSDEAELATEAPQKAKRPGRPKKAKPSVMTEEEFKQKLFADLSLLDELEELEKAQESESEDKRGEQGDSQADQKDSEQDIEDKKEDTEKPKTRRRRKSRFDEKKGHSLNDLPQELPLLPLRDVVVFNNMVIPLFVGRDISIQAIETSAATNQYLLLCVQRDEEIDEPKPSDLYDIGTVAQILRVLKMPDGRMKALVQGIARARVLNVRTDNCMHATIELIEDPPSPWMSSEGEALMRLAREQCERILALRGVPTSDIMSMLSNVIDPGRLADLIATNLRLKYKEAQSLLECLDPSERLRNIIKFLSHELEVAQMQAKIQSSTKEGIDKAQRDYFLREQLNAIRKELGDTGSHEEDIENLKNAIEALSLPEEAQKEADKQLKRLSTMHNDSAEASVIRTYLDWIVDLPWSVASEDQLDINHAQEVLDEDHFGLDKIKERILEFLSVRKLKPDSKGSIVCFVGPPGVGKTSLGRSIAKALGRKFYRFSLGGMRDEAEIRGHRRTYIGAMPGRIIQALKQVGTNNPVIMFDEIDKVGSDFRGDPSSALLEVLDPEQNVNFSDHYLNVPFDLSKVLFLCTANRLDTIPQALRDRLEIISLTGYTDQEKLAIAKKYLVPKQVDENGLEEGDISLKDAVLTKIIREYTREAGLRNVEREIGAVCRKTARRKAEGGEMPYKVTPTMLANLLGPPRYLEDDKEEAFAPGIALGLAYTPFGGDVLHIEVCTMQGKGKLQLTGQLGEVMKESAQAAMTYAKSNAKKLALSQDILKDVDLHVHVPAGATPKDGPSAGVALISALLSALLDKSLRADTCMTGEITLRGRVLPVGGIKEKILAGVTHGLKHVIIPKNNIKDLADVPADLLKKIEVHPVSNIEELLPLVFVSDES